jgi:hypothetical protein
MTLTAAETTALNNLPKYVPALAPDKTGNTGTALKLGDEIAAVGAGLTPGVVTALKAAATATVVANGAPTAVADAVGDVGAGALANDLKLKYNALVTLVNDLKTQHNALANGIDALP